MSTLGGLNWASMGVWRRLATHEFVKEFKRGCDHAQTREAWAAHSSPKALSLCDFLYDFEAFACDVLVFLFISQMLLGVGLFAMTGVGLEMRTVKKGIIM